MDIAASEIHISNPNITSVEAMNMPASGQIIIANRAYSYSSFEMTVTYDKDNKPNYEYVFKMKEGTDMSSMAGKSGREVSVGRAIDSRGVPYYMSQMNEFLRSFCRKFNDLQIYGNGDGTLDVDGKPVGERYEIDPVTGLAKPKEINYQYGGVDTAGNQMGAFFVALNTDGSENTFLDTKKSDGEEGKRVTYRSDAVGGNYYQLTAGNLRVNDKSMHDSNYLATSRRTDTHESDASLVDEVLELESKAVIYRGSGGDQFLHYIISDISIDANEADILAQNYSDIGTTIDTYRMSISSVDEDEEGMDLVKFNNAYNMASKIISTLNQMYDRLITQTGV